MFIDRWSRRQILVWSALLRTAFVVLTAALVTSGNLGAPLYVGVLLVLGVNRFFLSSLSAALPHVVAADKLVMANSVSPTAGGIMASVGGIVGLGVHVATGSGRTGSAVTLLVAGGCYLLASLVARTMPRALLGPSRTPGERPPGRVAGEFATGARRAGRRGPVRAAPPRAGRGAGRHRRQPVPLRDLVPDVDPAVPELLLPLGREPTRRSAITRCSSSPPRSGYACAALITPRVAKTLGKPAWITVLLAAAALISGPLGETFSQVAFLIIGFGLNLAGQGVAICATTILQEEVDDDYRGRVFSFYDMTFNVTFVAGAGAERRHSCRTPAGQPVIIGLVAVGYAVTAAAYWLASRLPSPDGGNGQPPSGAGGAPSPAPSAQRNSS